MRWRATPQARELLAPVAGTPVGASPAEGGHSHSMVPGGLLVTSRTTRFTCGTSLVIRVEMRSRTS